MYIDDGENDEIKVEVDGQEYTAEETVDYDHDGIADAAVTDTGDGGHLLYVDTDHDGVADEAITYSSDGDEVAEARFDARTGQWVGEQLGRYPMAEVPASPHGTANGAEDIHVDTPKGEIDAGPASVDSDRDGRNDTVIVHDDQGDTVLYTDTNGDGEADVATLVASDGHTETLRHTGPHQWTPASDTPDPASDQHWTKGTGDFDGGAGSFDAALARGRLAEGVVRIDTATGQWISPN